MDIPRQLSRQELPIRLLPLSPHPPFTYRNHWDSLLHQPRTRAPDTGDKHYPHAAAAAQSSTPDTASVPVGPGSMTAEGRCRRDSVAAGGEGPARKAFDVAVAAVMVVGMIAVAVVVVVVEGDIQTAEVAAALAVHHRRACR